MSLISDFNDRKNEIICYIELLEQIETMLKTGHPLLSANEHGVTYKISPSQQKILYSSLYLQLYNLVESTVTKCIASLEKNIQQIDSFSWCDLTDSIRRELLRSIAQQHESATVDTRTGAILNLLDHMFNANSKINISIHKKGGGNWDDKDIYALTKRIGLQLTLTDELTMKIKKNIYNDKRGLELVKHLRNKLAHGELSFVECGERLSFEELKILSDTIFSYLEVLISHFELFIEDKLFMAQSEVDKSN